VRGHLYTKQFPLEKSVVEMRAWREEQIGRFGEPKKDVLHAVAFDAPRLPRTEKTWCYIYFARSGDVVKIGRSVDPPTRLRELQTTHAGELVLLAAVAGHVALEGAIHQRFAHVRTRPTGEWFRLEPDLVAFIALIQQGANPVALLFEDPRVVLGWHVHPPRTGAGQGDPFSPARPRSALHSDALDAVTRPVDESSGV
jgi:hypothetical protein